MKNNILNAVIGLATLALVGWGIYSFTTNVQGSLVTPLILAGIAIYVQAEIKKREIASRHFESKKEAYSRFVDTLVQQMRSEKERKKKISDDQLVKEITELNKNLMLWGNAGTVKTFLEFSENAPRTGSEIDAFLMGDALIRSIRKDLGHNDRQLPKGELSLLLIKGMDREQLRKKIQEQ